MSSGLDSVTPVTDENKNAFIKYFSSTLELSNVKVTESGEFTSQNKNGKLVLIRLISKREALVLKYILTTVEGLCASFMEFPYSIMEDHTVTVTTGGILGRNRNKTEVSFNAIATELDSESNKGAREYKYVILFNIAMGLLCLHKTGIVHANITGVPFGEGTKSKWTFHTGAGPTREVIVDPIFKEQGFSHLDIVPSATDDVKGFGKVALELYGFSSSDPLSVLAYKGTEISEIDSNLYGLLAGIFGGKPTIFTSADLVSHPYFHKLGNSNSAEAAAYKIGLTYASNAPPPNYQSVVGRRGVSTLPPPSYSIVTGTSRQNIPGLVPASALPSLTPSAPPDFTPSAPPQSVPSTSSPSAPPKSAPGKPKMRPPPVFRPQGRKKT